MSTWVYIRSEPGLWTVGFYDPDGKWHPDSDYNDTEQAAKRVHYLNGGDRPTGQPEWLSQALNEGDGTYKP